jgi:predicted transcriptional regulator
MKSVLLSIKPKYCELIASGKKTVEIRKNRPKIDVPFKVYIYCTKNGLKIYGDGKCYVTDNFNLLNEKAEKGFEKTSKMRKWNCKVIGEFVCDGIYSWGADDLTYGTYYASDDELNDAFITYEELWNYGKGKTIYAWHISDLVIYDKPKELSEFYKEDFDEVYSNWEDLFSIGVPTGCSVRYPPEPKKEDYTIQRPPQSWCYVEEMNDNG